MMARPFSSLLTIACFALIASVALPAVRLAGPLRPEAQEPDDEEAYERALAERTWRDNCLMCHTAEMVSRQRLTAAQWTAEVDKMIGWGAPVPPEDRERLIAFLAAEFPLDKPQEPLDRMPPDEVRALSRIVTPEAVAGDPEAGAKLYKVHCASCHGADARGGDLGTNLVERPVLVQPEAYNEVVRMGLRRMPGFREVLKPEQEADLLAWLRQRRFTSP